MVKYLNNLDHTILLVLPEYGHSYIIDTVSGPVIPKHAWYYDALLNDFMLRPLLMLEETTGPVVVMRINGFELRVPASWYILLVDEETKMVDTIPVNRAAGSGYKAYMMHPDLPRCEFGDVQLLDLCPDEAVVHLVVAKQQLVCHPVGPTNVSKGLPMSVLIGPQDVGRHMGNLTSVDLLS